MSRTRLNVHKFLAMVNQTIGWKSLMSKKKKKKVFVSAIFGASSAIQRVLWPCSFPEKLLVRSVAFSPFPFHYSIAGDRPPAEKLIQSRQMLWSRVTELWLNYGSSETDPYQESWRDVLAECNTLARGTNTQLSLLPEVREGFDWVVASVTLFKRRRDMNLFTSCRVCATGLG